MSIDVNIKKPIKLKNRTKYYNPQTSRTEVRFGSPYSYQSKQIKIEGYESRLYWQYRYCDEHNGQTFFYTLTYAEKNIPKYLGKNCFNYEDLRQLLTGGFRKYLLRRYGTVFKYFVGAELGDGKGTRGFHNNPHYHVLFFLESANSNKYPYRKIEPILFRHLVRKYWQGFDEDTDGYKDYRTCTRFGIVQEGEPPLADKPTYGKVIDFRACMYCAKYVTKDVGLVNFEANVETYLTAKYRKDYYLDEELHHRFFNEVIRPKYEREHEGKTATDAEIADCYIKTPHFVFDKQPLNYVTVFTQIGCETDIWKEWHQFYNEFIKDKVHKGICEYRNRYCNKCRISHGVGDYAIQHIQDFMNPAIEVPSKNGMKNRPLSMYYYRKIYTDVKIDCVGSNIRVLNQLGIKYKLYKLDKDIEKMAMNAYANFEIISHDRELYEKMKSSDVNTEVVITFNQFKSISNEIFKQFEQTEPFRRYAAYKLVYEDRFCQLNFDGNLRFTVFPVLDYHKDLQRILHNASYFRLDRSDNRLDDFLENHSKSWVPYYAHPNFLCFNQFFAVLDLCTDYFFIQNDTENQKKAEEINAVRKFHKKREMRNRFRNKEDMAYHGNIFNL